MLSVRNASAATRISLAVLALSVLAYGLKAEELSTEKVAIEREPARIDAAPDQPLLRQREGTAIEDAVGYFKMTGDRAMFYVAGQSTKLNCLENLNLERVTAQLAETPDQNEWTVSGTLTEYRGANYLLLSRAVLKSKPTAKTRVKQSTPARKQPASTLRSTK